MLPLIHSSKSKVSLVINDTSLLANVFPLCAVAHFGLERIAVVKKIYESFCKKSFQFQIDIIIVVTEFHSTKMQKYFLSFGKIKFLLSLSPFISIEFSLSLSSLVGTDLFLFVFWCYHRCRLLACFAAVAASLHSKLPYFICIMTKGNSKRQLNINRSIFIICCCVVSLQNWPFTVAIRSLFSSFLTIQQFPNV